MEAFFFLLKLKIKRSAGKIPYNHKNNILPHYSYTQDSYTLPFRLTCITDKDLRPTGKFKSRFVIQEYFGELQKFSPNHFPFVSCIKFATNAVHPV
ncbi:hypothetical protein C8N25_101360 [Algoriphagus antarcticus]|uniref:Uncharacterized protein n=1 Tax=Algoriphagus antarcticus TaxID=238540 RepID=A0A3E0E8F7_9BACT|nr:hypothetical protein C8N25_101360 [Algoriphagus antarcticus]